MTTWYIFLSRQKLFNQHVTCLDKENCIMWLRWRQSPNSYLIPSISSQAAAIACITSNSCMPDKKRKPNVSFFNSQCWFKFQIANFCEEKIKRGTDAGNQNKKFDHSHSARTPKRCSEINFALWQDTFSEQTRHYQIPRCLTFPGSAGSLTSLRVCGGCDVRQTCLLIHRNLQRELQVLPWSLQVPPETWLPLLGTCEYDDERVLQ